MVAVVSDAAPCTAGLASGTSRLAGLVNTDTLLADLGTDALTVLARLAA